MCVVVCVVVTRGVSLESFGKSEFKLSIVGQGCVRIELEPVNVLGSVDVVFRLQERDREG